MAVTSEFVEYLFEPLAPLGRLRSKRMFGGWGLYADELFFAIAINDTLYIKADTESQDFFIATGSSRFTYAKKDGSSASLNYFEVSADILEDTEALLTWARRGKAAALRALAKK